ncbi:MAG: 30S ribosomal protein S20, partial [Bacillota bacterium]|nr:30S ribosomal protein S20 [Bacillota bacterium]
KDTAKAKLVLAEKKLKKAAAKGVIHKNAASRKVSRLNKNFNRSFAE